MMGEMAMTEASNEKSTAFGLGSMAIAALALLVAVVHLSLGPVAPQKPIETTIAEKAVAIKEAARRVMTGEPKPEPKAESSARWSTDQIIELAVLALAGIAVVLAVVALVRREQQRLAFAGFSLGTSVLLITWLQWIALVICGAIIVAAIIHSLGDLLPSP